MPRDQNLIPHLQPNSEPPRSAYREAQTLSRTLDRATGEIESRADAEQRYREEGLPTPERDPYYEA
jgi:hypothetical protein